MFFYMPTKIYAEHNCVLNHKKEIATLGDKALIVTGKHSSRSNGSLNDVLAALEAENITYVIYDKVEENPSVETVMDATAFGIQNQVDFVIGIGGGSPLDASKAIALMLYHTEKKADFLFSTEQGKALPVVAIPTTCGTGSEATPYAILTLHEKRTKQSLPHKIFPAFAFVDAKYLTSMPESTLVATSIDALGHFIESYLNNNATDFSDMLCEKGMRTWSNAKSSILVGNADTQQLEMFMMASSLAGMAISHTGTSLPHGLSYYLTYEKGIAHGRAVGIFLPAYLDAADTKKKNDILNMIGFSTISEFKTFIQQSLGTIEVEKAFAEASIMGMMNNQGKLKNCPFPVTTEVMRQILEQSLIVTP